MPKKCEAVELAVNELLEPICAGGLRPTCDEGRERVGAATAPLKLLSDRGRAEEVTGRQHEQVTTNGEYLVDTDTALLARLSLARERHPLAGALRAPFLRLLSGTNAYVERPGFGADAEEAVRIH